MNSIKTPVSDDVLCHELQGVHDALGHLEDFTVREPGLHLTRDDCRAILRDALDRLRTPVNNLSVEREDWQPIETAPKDGTVILVYFNRPSLGVMSVYWDDPFDSGDGIWCVDDNKHGPYAVRGYIDGDDTHWMPLPKPPRLQSSSDSGVEP